MLVSAQAWFQSGSKSVTLANMQMQYGCRVSVKGGFYATEKESVPNPKQSNRSQSKVFVRRLSLWFDHFYSCCSA